MMLNPRFFSPLLSSLSHFYRSLLAVKLDWCGDIKKQVFKGAQAHRDFAAAVNATGRTMHIEVVAGYFFLWSKIATVANSWRFCTDHHDVWKSTVAEIACRADQFNVSGAPGGWPYLDFLMTGGAGCKGGDHCPGQTDDEYKTEFAVWSLTQSPMIVDTDVRNMTQIMRKALLNTELIELYKSTLTPPGTMLGFWACKEALACSIYGRKTRADGSEWILALVNTGDNDHRITADFKKLGWTADAAGSVIDVWDRKVLSNATGSFEATVSSHGSTIVKVTKL